MAGRSEEGTSRRRAPVKIEFAGRRYRSREERDREEGRTAGYFLLWVARLRAAQDPSAGSPPAPPPSEGC